MRIAILAFAALAGSYCLADLVGTTVRVPIDLKPQAVKKASYAPFFAGDPAPKNVDAPVGVSGASKNPIFVRRHPAPNKKPYACPQAAPTPLANKASIEKLLREARESCHTGGEPASRVEAAKTQPSGIRPEPVGIRPEPTSSVKAVTTPARSTAIIKQ